MVSVLERAQAREIRVHYIRFAVWCVSDARLVSIDYRVTEADDHTRSVNERSAHHRVVSGQLHNAQTQANRPLTHAHTTRCVLELDVQAAQQGAESNGYRGTGPGERFRSVNE